MFFPSCNPTAVGCLTHAISGRIDWDREVNSPDQLAGLLGVVNSFYRDRLSIDLTNIVGVSDLVLDRDLEPLVTGLAQWWTGSHSNRIQRVCIRLRPGNSLLCTASVLCHEVFHLISAHRHLQLPQQLEEGVANLAQYLFLKHHGGAEALALQACLHLDDSEIYGSGFRMARDAYRRVGGLERTISRLQHCAVSLE